MTFKSIQSHQQNELKNCPLELCQPLVKRPRAVLYTRVSTQRQLDRIQSDVNSLEVQEETLRQFCEKNGYEVVQVVSDVLSSKNLKRPGIELIRSLVRAKGVEVVCAMSYDRIAGADEFGAFRSELKRNGVTLRLSDEPFNPETIGGEMMGRVQVAIKEYDRALVGEKVKNSFQKRAAMEMYCNGKPPFGFLKNPVTQILKHDPKKSLVVKSMFEVYVKTRSDFEVRCWLKAHAISSPEGKSEWAVGTIRDLLQNVRYIGLIEVNRKNKGRSDAFVSPEERYLVREAKTYSPIISRELWDLAQKIRLEQANKAPRPAKPRVRPISEMGSDELLDGELRGPTHNNSHNKSGHQFLLQGLIFCPVCGHPMSPDYTEKKPNEKEQRKSHSFTNYYTCSLLRKHPQQSNALATDDAKCGRVLASRVEKWAVGQIAAHVRDIHMIQAVHKAMPQIKDKNLQPAQQALEDTKRRLRDIQKQQAKIAEKFLSEDLDDALRACINVKAKDLARQHKILLEEQDNLRTTLENGKFTSYDETIDKVLDNFSHYAQYAKPEELQQILRLFIRRITCNSRQVFNAEFYRLHLPEEQYPGLLSRNEKGELEWVAAGSRVPWEFYRLQNRLKNQGVKISEKSNRR